MVYDRVGKPLSDSAFQNRWRSAVMTRALESTWMPRAAMLQQTFCTMTSAQRMVFEGKESCD